MDVYFNGTIEIIWKNTGFEIIVYLYVKKFIELERKDKDSDFNSKFEFVWKNIRVEQKVNFNV